MGAYQIVSKMSFHGALQKCQQLATSLVQSGQLYVSSQAERTMQLFSRGKLCDEATTGCVFAELCALLQAANVRENS